MTLSRFPLMPAEWDPRFDAVILAWPHEATDWASMLPEVEECYLEMLRALCRAGVKVVLLAPDAAGMREKIRGIDAEVQISQYLTNDTWTRDYGPLTIEVSPDELIPVCYKFNGWGLKFPANLDNLAAPELFRTKALTASPILRKSYVLEGGSLESDGCGTIMTTSECMLSPNRNGFIDKTTVERELAEGLGAQRVLWLDHGALAGDDTDSHIDTLARFAPHDTILYVKSYRPDDPHTPALERMEEQIRGFRTADGLPYNLIGLPLPDPIFDPEDSGQRLPATYANFLITPRAILLPVYGQVRNDRLASQMMSIAFPDHEIIPINCRALIRQHGSLHCSTMQIPARWMATF